MASSSSKEALQEKKTTVPVNQWIGLRENLQETIDFPIKYGAFRLKFSLNPIHWVKWKKMKGISKKL